MYQGRKESNELNLGPSLVLNLRQTLKNTYCYVVFDNVCNIPEQIQKLHEDWLYDLATAWCDRKNIPELKKDFMDQLKWANQLDRRSKTRFYLCLFFDLYCVALVNSFLVYKKLVLKVFNVCIIASKLIGSFFSQNHDLLIIVHQNVLKFQNLNHCLHRIYEFSWRQEDAVNHAQ